MISDKINLYNNKNNTRLHLKAVFFDMDGVLFDSMPAHAQAWIYALDRYGIAFTPQDVYMNEGRTGSSTINEVFMATHGRNATEAEIRDIYAIKSEKFDELNRFVPVNGVLNLLESVKKSGTTAYIVTGSGQKSLFEKINSHISGIFSRERMITAEDVTKGKPDPEPYLKALEKAKILPSEGIVIENAPLGVQSAVAAGIFTIAVNTGILPNEVLEKAGANVVYENMGDVARRWQELLDCTK